MRHEKSNQHRDFKNSYVPGEKDEDFHESHDLDAESELRFQARHRAPYETYSPYTDEDYGSNAKVNESDYPADESSQPHVTFQNTYRYDQNLDGSSGGSISFGRRTGGLMDYSNSASEVEKGKFSGVGPKGYASSDERIHEDICEVLTHHSEVDASSIECSVKEGDVTLTGSVPDRHMKFLVEEVLERCHGVKEIHNQLKISSAPELQSSAADARQAMQKNASPSAKKSPDLSSKH